ncbi:gamma-tubulin complex component 4-like [Scylla paramamosain]|uniref:gamma-tubulin complex component 4-like n=1 Tax=Scylla paramamosain TaxID=85552 RepID=UPI00308313FD
MLHDLLAAMKGHGGGIFVWRGSKFKVNNDLGLLHPCEVAIVEEIMDVATDFKKITSFCDAHDGGGVETGDHHGGIYLSSLSAALRATATTTFHRTVLELEEKLLFDPELPLTTALVAVRPLGPTLATLATLVTQIEEKHLHGCQILEDSAQTHSTLSRPGERSTEQDRAESPCSLVPSAYSLAPAMASF